MGVWSWEHFRAPFPGGDRAFLKSGGDGHSPDLTLPLVEMAEMDRPVIEVTMTDSRMMIQVRTEERDPQRQIRALSRRGPTREPRQPTKDLTAYIPSLLQVSTFPSEKCFCPASGKELVWEISTKEKAHKLGREGPAGIKTKQE